MRLSSLPRAALELGREELRDLGWKITRATRPSFKVSTRQGVFEVLAGDEAVGRQLFVRRQFELDYMSEVLELLRGLGQCPPRGAGTIVDVGANIGVTSIGMLHTGQFERAIAVEPEPNNFRLLESNCRLNGLAGQVHCVHCAASDRAGSLLFELDADNFAGHHVRAPSSADSDPSESPGGPVPLVISVPSDTVDRMLSTLPEALASDVTLLWVDVEGYEYYVFVGAEVLLSTGIPVVCEVFPAAMAQADVSMERFCSMARRNWTDYWVRRRRGFVRYPIETLPILFEELGWDGEFDNVVFTR